jgi:hypothetical protein
MLIFKRLKSKITQRYLGANKTKSLHRIVKIDKGFNGICPREKICLVVIRITLFRNCKF